MNITLKQDKFNLSKKLRMTEEQLKLFKKQSKNINVLKLEEEKQKYKN